ncbi:raffinose family of oligosaccharides transporter [Truncatella angustata]|uniref:Raffinose family of oligosaccharides transporter n=1 Tax=Truncatella angustata TaxID=152316 RepID=A0A9P8U825_9PEZI|nr:raffinose family of oligosaccharides transporter [Truncatella angustata]KAH6643348.1 raffinose family of oligosaccharides transporter [Truncatella angustata]
MEALVREAAAATSAEHEMDLLTALKLYRKAVGWSVLLSTAIIMEGFDGVILGSLYAYPPFQRKFGEIQPDGAYQLTAAWQSGLSNGALVGEILGLFLNGIIAERIGYRYTMLGALVLVTAFIFVVFFSETLVQLFIGEILLGIPWGVFQTLTTTYACEVCPIALRAYLTTYVNLCWVLGQFLASGVLRAMVSRTDEWGYRIPFGLQWMWTVPLIIGVSFAPESPWWLVRRGRVEDAKSVLVGLTSKLHDANFNADETISMMVHTNELEKAVSKSTTYSELFKGSVSFRRTGLVCIVWAIQTLCGSTFMGYSTYFYQQAGMAVDVSFTMTLVQYVMGTLGTIASWSLMRWFGRRSLYLWGQLIMFVLLLAIGCTALTGKSNDAAQWAIGTLLLLYTFVYDSSVGPVCYSLVAELSSTRLRAKTVVLARNVYNVVGIATNFITPRMLNPSAWDWGAKAGFFWAGSCLFCAIWTFFCLPEPKDRTYAELNALFEQKVSARKFQYTDVDLFSFTSSLEMTKYRASPEYLESFSI